MFPHKPKRKSSQCKSRRICKNKFSYVTFHIGWLNISLCLIFIIGVFIYLFQISESTTKGYEISSLSRQLSEYESEVKKYEQKINNMKSVEYIAAGASQLNMVAAKQIEFLAPISTGVALRY